MIINTIKHNISNRKYIYVDASENKMLILLHDVKEHSYILQDKTSSNEKYLIKNLDKLLSYKKIEMDSLDYLAICVGPGSFTGNRITVNSINAIAYSLNLKIAPLTHFDILYNKDNNISIGCSHARVEEYFIKDFRTNKISIKNKKELIDQNKNILFYDELTMEEKIKYAIHALSKIQPENLKESVLPLYIAKSQAERLLNENNKNNN